MQVAEVRKRISQIGEPRLPVGLHGAAAARSNSKRKAREEKRQEGFRKDRERRKQRG